MATSLQSPASPTPSGWCIARRLLLGAAAVATLIAAFYTVENWRGKRAWEKTRRALEAQGAVLDWAAYIPAPVPDEQNFYKAPHMQDWFVREHFAITSPAPPNAPAPFFVPPHKGTNLVLAQVTVVGPNAVLAAEPTDAVLRFEDAAAPAHAAELLHQVLGPCALGPRACVLLGQPAEQFKTLHLVLQTDQPVPSTKQLAAFFPRNPVSDSVLADSSYVQMEQAGSNCWRLVLKLPAYGAADYLAWTEPLTPQFDLVRKALERPYARIDCDYQQPFGIALPNFVCIRDVTQTLCQRAQCDLLLRQPAAALQELSLVHDLNQILGPKPPGTPETLVAAMVSVAVMGLYADMIKDGLRLHAWHEPQLLVLERQLQATDLLTLVVRALKEERAASSHTFESLTGKEVAKLFSSRELGFRLALTWMPRGWFYQNMVTHTEWAQAWPDQSVDLTNRLVQAHRFSESLRQLSPKLEHPTPYSFMAALATPNFMKALQTTARNQTLVNQAAVACALERYHLAQGRYPETLEALMPQFLKKLPHDLIGGQPLKYRSTEGGGGYQLYSIGWNEKDDGGTPGKSQQEGDWVWEVR